MDRWMRMPREIDVEITSRCNLRCSYCYFFSNAAVEYRDVTTDQWLAFFAELGRCGVMSVTLAGGEPFMRKDLPVLLEGITRNRMRFSLLSNGALITEDLAAFIAGTHRCNVIQISVDGSNAEVHEACRGRGSFEGALRGIRLLQKHRISVTARMTIHQANVHDIENTVHMLLDDLGLRSMSTNAAGYLGVCRQNAEAVMLTTGQRQQAMQTLLRLAGAYNGRISAMAGPLCEARLWGNMEKARLHGAPQSARGGRLTACGCPSTRMAVRADGMMIPCSMLAHMELGRINEASLLDVWQNSPALSRLRGRDAIPLSEFAFCAGCSYVPYCTGNCPGLAYTITGQVDHPSPDACLRRYLADGGRLVEAG